MLDIQARIPYQVDRSKWWAETEGQSWIGINLQLRVDIEKPFTEVRDYLAPAEQHTAN